MTPRNVLESFKDNWSNMPVKEKAAIVALFVIALWAITYQSAIHPSLGFYGEFCSSPSRPSPGLFQSAFTGVRENVRKHVCD